MLSHRVFGCAHTDDQATRSIPVIFGCDMWNRFGWKIIPSPAFISRHTARKDLGSKPTGSLDSEFPVLRLTMGPVRPRWLLTATETAPVFLWTGISGTHTTRTLEGSSNGQKEKSCVRVTVVVLAHRLSIICYKRKDSLSYLVPM